MPDSIAYLNGEYLRFADARLPVWDYAVVQGATVTDMIRTFAGKPFRLEQHLRRFAASRAVLGIELPENDARLAQIVTEVLDRNRGSIPAGGDLGVLLFATPGPYQGYLGLADEAARAEASRPTLCVHPFTLAFRRFHQSYGNGVALAVPQVRQISPASIPPGIKYRSRLHWYLGERQARAIDPQAAALLLDEHGCVTETNSGNLFLVHRNQLLTPRAETTLTGVSQEFVMELARASGWPVVRADLTPDFVARADEVFLTSTTYCVMPVTRLNNVPIGDGTPGPLARQLLAQWSAAVGIDLRRQAELLSGQ
jgi:branched-subunit amino acid aminotransferase/4-amino-4-deoxychorismate lyase